MTRTHVLDRHALVMAIWLSFGLIAVTLVSYGLGADGWPSILLAFGAIIAAFGGHVIVNMVYRTTFTPRELALGLVIYAAGLIAFGLATLIVPQFAARHFLPVSAGFLAVFAAVVFYMITHFGVRRAFTAFDVVRSFGIAEERGTQAWRGEPR